MAKIRRLPDLDLARIAALPTEAQRRPELEAMTKPPGRVSYYAFRKLHPDILNVRGSLPLASSPTPWTQIAADIQRAARMPASVKANLAVAEGLYRFALEHKLKGNHRHFLPMGLGLDDKVVYWSPCILDMGGTPVVPFFDPRRVKGLTKEGRRFVFSVMHQRVRALDPDLASVRLAIFQFGDEEKGPRSVIQHYDDGIELMDLDELEERVRETFALWVMILKERAA